MKKLLLLLVLIGCSSNRYNIGYKPYDDSSDYVRGVADGYKGGCTALLYVGIYNYQGLFTEKQWEHNVDYAEKTKICHKMWEHTLDWMN